MICPALPQRVNLPAMLRHSGDYVSQYSFQVEKTYHMNLGKPSLSLESDHLWNQFLRRHVQSLSGKRLSTHQVSLSALPAGQTMMAAIKYY